MNAIETKGLTKRYGDFTAVDSLDLTIGKGELFSLLGVNGAGKTTTVKMLSCLCTPSAGDAFLLGDSILTDIGKVKAKTNVSPQETAVAMRLTVRGNLEFMARIYGFSRKKAKEKAQEMIEKFSLSEKADKKAKTLSGGQMRRLSIAMALISEPEILFLDEPTLGLDVLARRELWTAIEELKGNVTVVLTTHYMEEAQALSDRIGIMQEGRLCAVGTAQELMDRTGKTNFEEAFVALAARRAEE